MQLELVRDHFQRPTTSAKRGSGKSRTEAIGHGETRERRSRRGKGTVSHVKMSQTVEFSPNGMPDGCRGRNSDEEQMEEVEEVVETVEGIA